jgi:hypothetical protein
VTAQIFEFSDYRNAPASHPVSHDDEIDLVTAVDVALRDLREILNNWGSAEARQRAQECELMLRRVFDETVVGPTAVQPT